MVLAQAAPPQVVLAQTQVLVLAQAAPEEVVLVLDERELIGVTKLLTRRANAAQRELIER